MLLTAEYDRRINEGRLKDDPAQRAVLPHLDELAAALVSPAREINRFLPFRRVLPPKGLYLWGGVGRGKSMLMDMFAAAINGKVRARRFHFHDFMVSVHDRIHAPELSRSADPAREVARSIADGAKVICFDEMEIRDIADAMIVARVIEGFMDGGGVLVTTSNRHPDCLYEGGLHRERFLPFIELIKARMTVHELASQVDWRQQIRKGMAGWYTPLGQDSDIAMEKAFDQLRGGVPEMPQTIEVAGRKIEVPRAAGSVAMMGFDHLCSQPLAARDYLVLADRFSGLLITGIPVLDDMLRNEARRFMWLVDAFYDRGRFLVCSAAAGIDKLYQGDAWKKEFPRTQSRLVEMTVVPPR
ncbi:cell division protein ZapE [Alphaproteobacteria bacterium LSUCC0684]